MKQKRIIVLESQKLLSAGIYSLLSAHDELDVFGLTLRSQDFFFLAKQYQPDVIIMDERFLDQNLDSYLDFIRSCPRLRTIVFNAGTNSMEVCDRQIIHVGHLDDFLDQL